MNEMKLVVGVRVLQTGFVSCETLIPAQAVLQKVGGAVGGPGFARSFVFWNTHPKKTTFSFAFSVVSVSVSHHVCIICLSTKRNIHAVLKKVYNCFTLGYRLSVPVLCSDPTRLDEPSACQSAIQVKKKSKKGDNTTKKRAKADMVFGRLKKSSRT